MNNTDSLADEELQVSLLELRDRDIQELIDKNDWVAISGLRCLTEDFIRENQDRVVWSNILYYQNISEDFIREFKDNKIIWFWVPYRYLLSEKFMVEFKDRVNWNHISSYQKLSYEFVKQNISRLDYSRLIKNRWLDSKKVKQIYEQYGQFNG